MPVKKILLINSDLAKNRGDRAIAEGIIQLAQSKFPGAKITGLSEQAERDRVWFGIDFLPIDTHSVKPLDLLKLMWEAHRSDFVLWGGGELLKDYTNKLALWYWCGKMLAVRLANRNIYGVFQGIGPTGAKSSRRMIKRAVKRCRKFVVRDQESYDKLTKWGVPAKKLVSSSDPAVLPTAHKLQNDTKQKLFETANVDDAFLGNFIAIGPRSWFHYKQGGVLPYKHKQAIAAKLNLDTEQTNPRYETYCQRLVDSCESLIRELGCNILLVPMHMSESDKSLCEFIKSRSASPDSIQILSEDNLSPNELRSVLSMAKAMVGFRLHSTIIATSSGVPSLNIYYVDKGRVYFDQIGMSDYALPIEKVLDEDFTELLTDKVRQLIDNRGVLQGKIGNSINKLRHSIEQAFEEIFN